MYRLRAGAVEAADMTAPVESAVASLRHLLDPGLVSSSTAQQLTAVQSRRGTVTGPFRRADRPGFAIVRAKIRRLLEVHQVLTRGEFMRRIFRLEVPRVGSVRRPIAALVGVDHSGGAIKTVLQ